MEFTGRLLDLVECVGHDGRPDPTLAACNGFRQLHGLEPIQRASTANARPPRTDQKPLTLFQKAKSVGNAAVNVVKTRGAKLSQEQIDARLAICQACEQYEAGACKLCTCPCNGKPTLIGNKLAHPKEQCPHDPPKWGKVEPA